MGKAEPKFTFLDKAVSIATGPFLGWLPPRMQCSIVIDHDGFGYERAKLLSSSSRAFNAAWSLYALGAAAARHYGVDIDPTHGNYIMWAGVGIGVDTIVRELCRGAAIAYHGDSAAGDIWGSPLASSIDRVVNPGAYRAEPTSSHP